MPALPPAERFMRHIRVNPETGCWVWTSTTSGSRGRYPTFQASTKWVDGKVYAHRWAYQHFVGPIRAGHEIDHVQELGCITNLCVKAIADEYGPAHLEAVTFEENQRRRRLKVCRSGRHDLTDPANVQWDAQGRRRGCKACTRDRERRRIR